MGYWKGLHQGLLDAMPFYTGNLLSAFKPGTQSVGISLMPVKTSSFTRQGGLHAFLFMPFW